ncbi:hypothetical protein LCL85_15395 [Vibrio alginolyticus]|nr:hypothetical protein [Vibrio alginolyticus]
MTTPCPIYPSQCERLEQDALLFVKKLEKYVGGAPSAAEVLDEISAALGYQGHSDLLFAAKLRADDDRQLPLNLFRKKAFRDTITQRFAVCFPQISRSQIEKAVNAMVTCPIRLVVTEDGRLDSNSELWIEGDHEIVYLCSEGVGELKDKKLGQLNEVAAKAGKLVFLEQRLTKSQSASRMKWHSAMGRAFAGERSSLPVVDNLNIFADIFSEQGMIRVDPSDLNEASSRHSCMYLLNSTESRLDADLQRLDGINCNAMFVFFRAPRDFDVEQFNDAVAKCTRYASPLATVVKGCVFDEHLDECEISILAFEKGSGNPYSNIIELVHVNGLSVESRERSELERSIATLQGYQALAIDGTPHLNDRCVRDNMSAEQQYAVFVVEQALSEVRITQTGRVFKEDQDQFRRLGVELTVAYSIDEPDHPYLIAKIATSEENSFPDNYGIHTLAVQVECR